MILSQKIAICLQCFSGRRNDHSAGHFASNATIIGLRVELQKVKLRRRGSEAGFAAAHYAGYIKRNPPLAN